MVLRVLDFVLMVLSPLDVAWSHLRERFRLPQPGQDSRPPWRRMFDRWRLPPAVLTSADLVEIRGQALEICRVCWWRWVSGRNLWHVMCSNRLERAVNIVVRQHSRRGDRWTRSEWGA